MAWDHDGLSYDRVNAHYEGGAPIGVDRRSPAASVFPAATQRLVNRDQIGGNIGRGQGELLLRGQQVLLCRQHLKKVGDTLLIAALRERRARWFCATA